MIQFIALYILDKLLVLLFAVIIILLLNQLYLYMKECMYSLNSLSNFDDLHTEEESTHQLDHIDNRKRKCKK